MTPYFALVRFNAPSGPYYPAIVQLTARDFRDAGESIFAFIAGVEIGHPCRISVEEISVNKPRGRAVSLSLGGPIQDPGLETFLQEYRK